MRLRQDLSTGKRAYRNLARSVCAERRYLTERVDFPKGEPENPLDEMEFKSRYDDLMKYGHQTSGDEVYRLIYAKETKIRKVMELMRGGMK